MYTAHGVSVSRANARKEAGVFTRRDDSIFEDVAVSTAHLQKMLAKEEVPSFLVHQHNTHLDRLVKQANFYSYVKRKFPQLTENKTAMCILRTLWGDDVYHVGYDGDERNTKTYMKLYLFVRNSPYGQTIENVEIRHVDSSFLHRPYATESRFALMAVHENEGRDHLIGAFFTSNHEKTKKLCDLPPFIDHPINKDLNLKWVFCIAAYVKDNKQKFLADLIY
jgi:hypothetical protein